MNQVDSASLTSRPDPKEDFNLGIITRSDHSMAQSKRQLELNLRVFYHESTVKDLQLVSLSVTEVLFKMLILHHSSISFHKSCNRKPRRTMGPNVYSPKVTLCSIIGSFHPQLFAT